MTRLCHSSLLSLRHCGRSLDNASIVNIHILRTSSVPYTFWCVLVSAPRNHFSLWTLLSDLGWDLSEKLKKWQLGFSLFLASCSPGLKFHEAVFYSSNYKYHFCFLISQSRNGECLNRRKGYGLLVLVKLKPINLTMKATMCELQCHSPVKYRPRELVTCEWALSLGVERVIWRLRTTCPVSWLWGCFPAVGV